MSPSKRAPPPNPYASPIGVDEPDGQVEGSDSLPPSGLVLRNPYLGNPLLVPAVVLLILGTLQLLYATITGIAILLGGVEFEFSPDAGRAERWAVYAQVYGIHFGMLVVAIVTIIGSIAMIRLKGFKTAAVAGILNCVPLISSCCVVGLPFGIWASIVLFQPGIKSRFR